MGKVTETAGDSLQGFTPDLTGHDVAAFLADPRAMAAQLLGDATTRVVYDAERYFVSQKPAFAAVIARETHASDLHDGTCTKTQVRLGFSDGFGREIQGKLQAEAGPLSPGAAHLAQRWIGSGWTVFNNKGNPVRQYEPFFSASPDFEFAVRVGVSPILFYDPVGRAVATLHPDHTYDKAVFDAWGQAQWDVNDTVLLNPATDPEVGGFLARLADHEYLPTWHAQRITGALGAADRRSAQKTAHHAGTPTTTHFDALGRTILSIADNGADAAGTSRKYATRTLLDIEGRTRRTLDPLDRIVVVYDYDRLGRILHQESMDAGERWIISDVRGLPIRTWNSRHYVFRIEYDALRRPTRHFVRGGDQYSATQASFPARSCSNRRSMAMATSAD